MPEFKLLGGKPAFESLLSITRPTMPAFEEVEPRLRAIFGSGMITLDKNVRELESKVAGFLGVRNVIATNSNSAGQMLAWSAWGLKGEVILPSFSFCMTSHVLLWNGLEPVFVDVDPKTCCVDPKAVEAAIGPKTVAIVGVHVWGNPCQADQLAAIAKKRKLKFLTDAAQSMGAKLNGRRVGGLADVEVFSCSPTKILTCGEGGLVATNDDALAARIRQGRVYGLTPDYQSDLVGLNARMSEMNAVLGNASFDALEKNLASRKARFEQYRALIGKIAGLSLPEFTKGGEPNGQYFTFYVEDGFGLDRDELYAVLHSENVMAKKYFDPPLHELAVNKRFRRMDLTHTERMTKRVLSLPLYSHSTSAMIEGVADVVARAAKKAPELKAALKKTAAAV